MRLVTKPFGEIEVDERQRIHFPFGIFGFESLHEYVLLDSSRPPFYWLQSVERPEIAFVLIDPKVFRPEYVPEVAAPELEDIDLKDLSDMLVFAIVTVPQDQALMTANLQGPIIINRHTKRGRQSISLNPRWKVRHYILDELAQKASDEAC